MPDREKVIKGIEEVREYIGRKGHDLASRKCRMMDKVTDALALLKEQEAVQVDLYGKDEWWCYVCICPDCKTEWMCDRDRIHYCPNCGRKVKWDA